MALVETVKIDICEAIFNMEPEQPFQRNCPALLLLEPLEYLNWARPLDWAKARLSDKQLLVKPAEKQTS